MNTTSNILQTIYKETKAINRKTTNRNKNKKHIQTEQLKKSRHMSQSKESLIWWKTPIQGESTTKCEKDPNELYNTITPKDRERYYGKTPEKGYNIPLLKDSERRRRALLRRWARDSCCTDFDQGT